MNNGPPQDCTIVTIDCGLNRIDIQQEPMRWNMADRQMPESKSFLLAQLVAIEAGLLAAKSIPELQALLLQKRGIGIGRGAG